MIVIGTLVAFLVVIFLIYASYSIQSGIYLSAFCKKQTTEKVVALTFDDGPDKTQTPKVLEVLKKHQVTASFFCIGNRIEGNEELLRRIVAEGHLIGNHSYSHTGCFPLYTFSKMKKDMQACQSALEEVISQPVRWFRPPFGVTNPTIAKAVRTLGYTVAGWNIRTLDTQKPKTETVLRRIHRKLKPGSIILLHDRMPESDRLLEQILYLIREQGYTVVRLDKMI